MKICRALLALTILAMGTTVTGCASQKTRYELSGRDPAGLAVVYGDKRTPFIHIREAGATICKIDGQNIDNLSAIGTCEEGPLYVEPGKHDFEVRLYVGAVTHALNASFELQPGHQYFFDATGSITGASVVGSSMSLSAEMAFWVEDRTTGAVVYGRRPDALRW